MEEIILRPGNKNDKKIHLSFSYEVYRVIDQQMEELQKSDNLFAIFIRTVLLSMKKGKVGNEVLVDLYVDLAQEVAKLGIEEDKTNARSNACSKFSTKADRKK